MTTQLNALIAQEHIADLHREARRARIANEAREPREPIRRPAPLRWLTSRPTAARA